MDIYLPGRKMMLVVIFLLICDSLSSGSKIGVYEEIYPAISNLSQLQTVQDCTPETSSGSTCPLFFGLLSSFGGIYRTSGCIPGVKMALDEINNDSSLLPGYVLHYTLKDSQCNRQVAMSSFFTFMLQPPVKLAIMGGGCSVATEPTAEMAYFYNLTQLSYVSSSPLLANRQQYRTYFQLLASESTLAYGYYGLIKNFQWRKIAIIGQMENLFTKVIDLLTLQLRANNISYTETHFITSDGAASLEGRLFDPGARVFIISAYSSQALPIICMAHASKMYYPRYQFIFLGWYDANWWVGSEDQQASLMEEYQCSVEDRQRVMQYSLAIDKDEFLGDDDSFTVDSGLTGARFKERYRELLAVSPFGNESLIYVQQSYDATWTLARALNQSMRALAEDKSLNDELRRYNSALDDQENFVLQHATYNNTALRDLMFEQLNKTDFTGISGRITFTKDGVRYVDTMLVFQYRMDLESGSTNLEQVASMNISNKNDVAFQFDGGVNVQYLWPHGMIPYDGVIIEEQVTVSLEVTVIYSILAVFGLALAVICIAFTVAFRHRKLIKLSSPILNYTIASGAVILYINMYLFVIPTKNITAISVLCNITPWFSCIGYSLCYGTVVMKMGRTFYIFNNSLSTSPKKAVHDWMLGLGVLILVFIDFVILIIFFALARNELTAESVQNRENPENNNGENNPLGVLTEYYIYVCDSTIRDITTNVSYGIKALIQIVALIFAFTIRKVNIKGLDDSPFVIAAIYVSSIFLAIIFVSSITLNEYVNGYSIIFCTGYFTATTTILVLTFIPKMIGLYKDPHGTKIFRNPHSEISGDRANGTKKIMTSRNHSASEINEKSKIPPLLKRGKTII